ncbi:hypothetical protein BST10_07840, partial [Mycolicibacter algericus DSM 45454]
SHGIVKTTEPHAETLALLTPPHGARPAGSRATCRSWARAIHLTWPHLDGLAVPSTMTGGRNIVLWNTARDSLPGSPAFSRALADPLVWSIAQAAAERIGYQIH